MNRTLTTMFLLALAGTVAAKEPDRPTTMRQVGRTTVITESDGSRTLCRPVGPQLVCTKEKKSE